jgi:RNA polymerase sigma factor (sigma-70 family)
MMPCDNAITEERTDAELLRDFNQSQNDAAFAQLVRRHINVVYSAAVRETREHHLAQDVVQATFIVFSRKAQSIRAEMLTGWLFKTALNIARNANTMRHRRQRYEQAASEESLVAITPELSVEHAPQLNAAIAKLPDLDRSALLLRFFESKSHAEIAAALNTTVEAARKRVERSLVRLRRELKARGIIVADLEALLRPNEAPASVVADVVRHNSTERAKELAEGNSRRFWPAVVASTLVTGLLLFTWINVFQRADTPAAALARVDIAYTRNNPAALFGELAQQPSSEEQSTLAAYVDASFRLRWAAENRFPMQEIKDAAYVAAADGLFNTMPPVSATHAQSPLATNIFIQRYPLRFVEIDGKWKWDFCRRSEASQTQARLRDRIRDMNTLAETFATAGELDQAKALDMLSALTQ